VRKVSAGYVQQWRVIRVLSRIALPEGAEMADTPYPADESNDLPRTVRQQQKEARARDQVARDILPKPAYAREAQQAQQAQNLASQRAAQTAAAPPPPVTGAPAPAPTLAADTSRAQDYAPFSRLPPGEFAPATVARFQVPFLHLVGFFLKAALAAIPALLLLGGLFWVLGQAMKTYMPWLLKMQILITFPG
jgi:hypothetical protein